MEIEFERLCEPLNPAYLGMTFAEHRHCLSALDRSSEIIAIGATLGAEPVGLGLARLDPDSGEGTVLSLLILPSLQGRGLGTALLEVLEHVLGKAGCQRGRIFYSTELASAATMERVLQKAGWSTPRRHMLIARVADPSLGVPGHSFAGIRMDPRLSFFPWVELTARQRADLERNRSSIPTAIWPFHDEDAPLEPAASIGLCHEGEVVGWLIAHRVAPSLVRYTSLYVREQWRSTKALLLLLVEAGRRQREILGPGVQTTLGVLADNVAMVRFVERRFQTYCHPFQEIRVAEKVLTLR